MNINIEYNLDEKINLIYDFLYNTNSKNCYSLDKITLGKIGINDIKFSFPDNMNGIISNSSDTNSSDTNTSDTNSSDTNTEPNEYEYYNITKKNVFNGRFKILQFDEEMKQVTLKKYSNQFPITIKISFYDNEDKIDSFDSLINNDSLFSYLFSLLVLNNKTKHILLPIMNIDIMYSDIEKIINDETTQTILKTALQNNEIINKGCIQIREHFFRTQTLEDYLKENSCSYKTLIFQVVHTLAILQKEYEGFRHNNLKLKNILIYLKKQSDSYTEYIFNDVKYYVPNSGFDIKITNFEYSIIPKYYGLINANNPNIKFADKINPYYDLYVFLNDLLEGTTLMATSNETNNCDIKTKKFLDKVIPVSLRGKNHDNFKKNLIVTTPDKLLDDEYFEEFKNKSSKKSIEETITNHIYLTGKKILTYMDSDNYSTLGNQNKIISKSFIMKNTRTIKSEHIFSSKSKKISDDLDDLEQIGGNEIVETKPFKTDRNTPFISNDQRDTFKKRATENPIREPPVILEQKVYDTSQRPATKPQFPPSFIPLYGQDGEATNHLLPYSRVINQPPVQKVYNINLANPMGDHTSINRVFEDMLPGTPFTLSALTLYERKQLVDYLRNNILESADGEEMTITGGKNSLLSYMKIMDINPYTIKKNPYIDLPRNFLLYRAAYPVRFDEKTKTIGIAKSSMGINVRMYMMSLGDLRCKTIGNVNTDNFDLWREVKYYNWVRETIVKQKISPNFISPILYKIDSESRIDWNKLEMIKSKGIPSETYNQLKENDKLVNKKHGLLKEFGLFENLLPLQFRKSLALEGKKIKEELKKIEPEKEDVTLNSGKVLVLLTEAPTSSFLQWCSPIYEGFGSVKKMVSVGYHSPDVWKSIIFQMVYACAVLQEQEIYIKKLSIENNVFIKDIFTDPNSVGSWIYKVDNIEYYIPNHGYILVIDSKYADIDYDKRLLRDDKVIKPVDQQYKMNGCIFGDAKGEYMSHISTQFKSLIDPDNFSHAFKLKGSLKPDDSIIDLLTKISNDTSSGRIKELIPKYFREFVHNRVGTLLLKSEKDNINLLSRPNYRKGNLMIYQKKYQEYIWVIYNGDMPAPSMKKKIITKDDANNYVEIDVFGHSLFGYPENEKVAPESGKHFKYDAEHIYETYTLESCK